MTRIVNFNPGPATLPLSVLEKAQKALIDFQGLGMGILEISHRSPEFMTLLEKTQEKIKKVFQIPNNFHILFCQGGARTQFAMLPMNFLKTNCAYLNTGTWADKAIEEAERFGKVKVIASSKDQQYKHYPNPSEYIDQLDGTEDYIHITSNNTVYGTQIHRWPQTKNVSQVVDMSSDIASRQLSWNAFDMVYAGAQKNLGAAGITLVFVRDSFSKKAIQDEKLPMMLRYSTFIESNSLYNTPPVFNIYVVSLMVDWLEEQGGIGVIEANNVKKAKGVYDVIDSKPDFYIGFTNKESRSLMNICFNLPSVELEKKLVKEALQQGFAGIKGHSTVGGIRISNYNAVPVEGMERFVDFLNSFAKAN